MDTLDYRDLTDRFEELEALADRDGEEQEEFAALTGLFDETRGYGGDHQWRGDWYPGYMIPESDFEDYARELAEDIGAINRDARWPNQYIDWKAAAAALEQDYTSVTFRGVDYLYR